MWHASLRSVCSHGIKHPKFQEGPAHLAGSPLRHAQTTFWNVSKQGDPQNGGFPFGVPLNQPTTRGLRTSSFQLASGGPGAACHVPKACGPRSPIRTAQPGRLKSEMRRVHSESARTVQYWGPLEYIFRVCLNRESLFGARKPHHLLERPFLRSMSKLAVRSQRIPTDLQALVSNHVAHSYQADVRMSQTSAVFGWFDSETGNPTVVRA